MDVKKSVGIWVRVSTDMQGDSPEHHRKRAEYYVQAKEGWEIQKVYQLEAVSGKTLVDVPEFKQMLSDIKKGIITGLIFSKLARVARNTRELLDLADYFRQHNADLISLEESIDTSTPAGRFFYTLIAAVGQWEREEIASRVAASVPIRAKLGKSTGGAASFGYRWESNKLVLDEKEAPIRKLMYEIFNNCKRKKATAAQLNNLGYRTRNGGLFTDTTVDRLIRDSSAKGMRKANYTKSRGKKKHWDFKDTSDWILVPCPPIVSIGVWNEANDFLNAQQKKRRKPGRLTEYLLTGFVECTCGKKMYVFHETRTPYFACRTCNHRIGVSELDEIYHAHLKIFLFSDDDISKNQIEAQIFLDEKIALFEISKTETEKLEEQMNELVSMRTNRELSPEDFTIHYQPIRTRYASLKDALLELESEIDVLKVQLASADVVIQEAKDLFTRWNVLTFEQKRTIVELITDQIVIDKHELTIALAKLPTHHPNSSSNSNGGNKQHNPRDS
ncbi:hypothetical protein A3860_18460 [Niastella vici]|uniref:Recombinase n=1 Tax=Niastella vici TaxID=1703345 RepID=A0A1V9G2E5_9BACT|nr:recombinase family protein [Niastella vici]OQP64742.1 hypothetical protein A3860_18460 [Niastella vici]